MSNSNQNVRFSLNVMFNKQKSKVLFAEADKAFTDVLLSFLTLPLGKIVRILEKHYGDKAPVIGSLTTLYRGVSNLDSDHFCTESGKQMLLDPRSWFCDEGSKLKLDINDSQPIKYFSCEDLNCPYIWQSNIGIYYGTVRCRCGKTLKRELKVKNVPQAAADDAKDRGFTMNKVTFLISDDLQIFPNAAGSVIQIGSNLGIADTEWGEIENVTFGFNDIIGLLKGFFISLRPLTEVVLGNGQSGSALPGFELGSLLNERNKLKLSCRSKKIILKVIIQKSTSRFLFAESQEDFVEFLFSSLIIPLGGVGCLLGGNTCLKNIDNLYRSIADVIDKKYLKCADTKRNLIEPKLPHGYGYCYKEQFLPVDEKGNRTLYHCVDKSQNEEYLSLSFQSGISVCNDMPNFKSPRGDGNYVMGTGIFMVADDLTVTPQCMASYVSTLNKLKIPLSDVSELVLHIGPEEAVSILKASLSSNSALSIGLSSILKKQPKQEG